MNNKNLRDGISLCVIVKNEELHLERMVNSVKDIVSEIIVVDTGSDDKTVDIANNLGARVFSYKWENNFSKARNFSLKQAKCKWILVLDADEYIANKDLFKIDSFVKESTSDAACLVQRNYCENPDAEGWQQNISDDADIAKYSGYFDVPFIRLFRNREDIYFTGVVHEVVDSCVENLNKRYLEVIIHHLGALSSTEERSKKGQFYLKLLLKQLEEDPENSTTWFLLGRQYYTLGKDIEAIAFLSKVVDSGTKCEMAYDNLASIYIRNGVYQEAYDILIKLIELNPRYYEAYSSLGIASYEIGRKDEGIDILKKALQERKYAFKPCFNLAAIFYREKRFEEAFEYINLAEKIMTQIGRVHYLRFFIAVELGKFSEAIFSAEKLYMLDKRLYKNIEEQVLELKTNSEFSLSHKESE